MPPRPPVPTADCIAAAARRVLEHSGAAAVSMRTVAAAVGVSAMAIYKHYPDRDALLARVVDDGFAELATRFRRGIRGTPRARLRAALAGYLGFVLAHPHLYDYAFAAPRPGARRFPRDFARGQSPTLTLIAAAVEDGVTAGTFRPVDPWDAAMSLWAHSHGLIALFRAGRFSLDRRAFARYHRQAVDRMLDGLSA